MGIVDIYYILYTYNGVGNQLCSIQTLAGLAKAMPNYTIHAVYPQHISGPKWYIQDPQSYQVDTSKWDSFFDNSNMPLLSMLDYTFPENVVLHKNDSIIKNRLNSKILNCQNFFVASDSATPEDLKIFDSHKRPIAFMEGVNNVITSTLIWYSKFLMKRNYDIDHEINKIRFTKEYTDLVDKIHKEIGNFSGTHVRIMPDHYSYRFTREAYDSRITELYDKGLPIVMSIDDWNHEFLKKNPFNMLNAHELILNEYRKDFLSLSHHNRVDLAILSMLLMIKSSNFVGTYGSTYTAYIQQQRAQRDVEDWLFFPGTLHDSYNKDTLPYSWYSLPPNINLCWERDWQECKLNV